MVLDLYDDDLNDEGYYEEDPRDTDNICEDCGRELPKPVYEDRGNGFKEAVIYCKCGATYHV